MCFGATRPGRLGRCRRGRLLTRFRCALLAWEGKQMFGRGICRPYLRFFLGDFFTGFDLAFAVNVTGFFPKSPLSQPW